MALLTLAGFALHTAWLTDRPLWLDEGFTFVRISNPWRALFTGAINLYGVLPTIDTHPPLYFALLKLWVGAAGSSDFALKYFSAAAGALAIPLIWRMIRAATGARAGLIAATLATLSPLLLWYSQEVRMYSMVVALSAAIGWALLRARRPVFWALLAAGLLTHYSFAALGAALILWLLLRAKVRISRQAWALPAGAIVFGALLWWTGIVDPAFLLYRLRSGAEYGYVFVPLYEIIGSINSGALFGVNTPDPSGGWISWALLALFIACAAWLWRARRHTNEYGPGLMLTLAAGPVLVWFVISLLKPNFTGVRQLMVVLPAWIGLWATVIARLSMRGAQTRVIAAGLALALLVCNSLGLRGAYPPAAARFDDWRTMAAAISAQWREGDLVAGNPGTPVEVLAHYLADLAPHTVSIANQTLFSDMLAHSTRLWYVDPGATGMTDQGFPIELRGWTQRAALNFQSRTITLQLLLLARPEFTDALPSDAWPIAAESPGSVDPAAVLITPANLDTPGMDVAFYWPRDPALAGKTQNMRLRLEAAGKIWWEAAWDERLPPAGVLAAAPDQRWLLTHSVLAIPRGLPALAYDFKLYSGEGDQSARRQIAIRSLSVADALRLHLDGLQPAPALCCDADIALASVELPQVVQPGQILGMAALWRPADAAQVDWDVGLRLERPLSAPLLDTREPACPAGACDWPAGVLQRALLSGQIPNNAPPGPYLAYLSRLRGGTELSKTRIGVVWVRDYSPAPIPNDITFPAQARAGELSLLGVRLPEPRRGASFTIASLWRVDARPARDGVLFLHIINPDGSPGPQDDNPPLLPSGAIRSTLTYHAGDGIDQPHRITLPADAAPGVYQIFVGVYDRGDGARWDALQDGAPARDNLILAGSFTLR